jgi:hypothetical protein
MAVTLVNDAQANHYVGLSGDAKPTTANVVAGARFIERDTGLEFIYDGSTWGALVTGATSSSGDVAAGAADSGNPVKMGGKYNAAAPTLDDGDRGDAQLDVNGNLRVVEGAVEVRSFSHVFGTDVDLSVKASAGHVMSVVATSINAAIRYLQIHNKATAPAAADVPLLSIPMSAGSATLATTLILGEDFFGKGGMACTVGIAIGISTTNATFTAATTTDHNYSVSWA